ncbi:HAD family hydrolase [Roseibium suaedae]|uniref:Haloacid dehalogenase superfamily, subfamily IA, variant 3 with third motif having DD or ED n=1 Tax=Roseibium suaedae TaxID=735517 RepID=A0A1M7MBH2_9HYPH|nr:HAD family hydrolase [Roseibium suaedae]SHM88078.1 haloacid dehalogenase superfamily, subfamily IA, variant 3 with third motif having DD or ED [Roseibium suaedae]
MTLELVIFDCDGVLVDTELTANTILAEIITDLGFPITAHECQSRFMGRTLESVKELVEELCSVKLADDWPDYIRKRDLEAFAKGVDPIPGITAVLDELDQRCIPYCVGSSGKYEKMRMTLGSSGLLPRLEGKLYSAQDCADGKPAPDVFLLAAKGMGKDPAACVVIEDSVPGLMAARSAGMRGFGYTADPHCDKKAMQEAGGTLFDRMEALPELLFPSN